MDEECGNEPPQDHEEAGRRQSASPAVVHQHEGKVGQDMELKVTGQVPGVFQALWNESGVRIMPAHTVATTLTMSS